MCCNPPSSQQLFAKWTRNSGCFRIWHVLGDGFGSIGILKKVSWLLKEWSGFVSCASLVFFSEACKHLHSIDSLDQKLRTHKFGACVQSNLYKQVNLTCHNFFGGFKLYMSQWNYLANSNHAEFFYLHPDPFYVTMPNIIFSILSPNPTEQRAGRINPYTHPYNKNAKWIFLISRFLTSYLISGVLN
jgi:hypothetical protein